MILFRANKSVVRVVAGLCFWALAMLVHGCCFFEHDEKMEGMLVGTGSCNEIVLYDLTSKKRETIYKISGDIGAITKVDNRTFLFCERQWFPVNDKSIIRQYDLKNRSVKTLFEGSGPTYIPKYKKIYFERSLSDLNERAGYPRREKDWLFVADYEDLSKIKKTAVPGDMNCSSIIQISPDEILVYGCDRRLRIYHLTSKRFSPTVFRNLASSMVWRKKTNELLCCDWDTRKVYLADIVSGKKKEIPKLKGAYGFIYFPEQDALIYSRSCFEANRSYYYSFESGDERSIGGTPGGDSGYIWIGSEGILKKWN